MANRIPRTERPGIAVTTGASAGVGRAVSQAFARRLWRLGLMARAGEGLEASAKGKRVRFSGDKQTVIDGPFAETKELIGGFWLWKVKSMDEAVEWLKRAPFREGDVEIRRLAIAVRGKVVEDVAADAVDRDGDVVGPTVAKDGRVEAQALLDDVGDEVGLGDEALPAGAVLEEPPGRVRDE